MKKLIVVIAVIVVFVVVGYNYFNIMQSHILEDSKEIAKSVISLYTTEAKVNTSINDKITEKLNSYYANLKSLDDAMVTIDLGIDTEYNQDAPPEEDEPYVEDTSTVPVEEDTEGIVENSDGTISIKVNSLTFSTNDYTEVVYQGVKYSVYKKDVPETYQMMLNNPEYSYKYLRTEKDKDVISVFYKSVYSDDIKIIKVKYNLFSGVSDFSVEGQGDDIDEE